jgi:ribosomal protein L3 glutamine methyltransferase
MITRRRKNLSESKSRSVTLGKFIRNAAAKLNAARLTYGHGTDNALDEAAWLVLETLGIAPEARVNYSRKLTKAEQARAATVIKRRIETRKPAAYLLNKAYMHGTPFYVDERVLVPRSFIGELLCIEEMMPIEAPERVKSVLDLCTGSGCLAILAAAVFPKAKVDAADLSAGALEVAKRNVSASGFKKRVRLFRGDLFSPLKGKKYDLIIANPPYVDAPAMKKLPKEYRHEPEMALASGKDGLDIVRRILKEAPHHLNKSGLLICEVGRGKKLLEKEYPLMPFLWLDTMASEGEVFMLTREQLTGAKLSPVRTSGRAG